MTIESTLDPRSASTAEPAARNELAEGASGISESAPVDGLRSGRMRRNCSRSRKNGSSRGAGVDLHAGGAAEHLVDRPGDDRGHVGDRVHHRAAHGRGDRAADLDRLGGAGAAERHLDDAVLLRVAGVVDLELVEDVRVERGARRLGRREERAAVRGRGRCGPAAAARERVDVAHVHRRVELDERIVLVVRRAPHADADQREGGGADERAEDDGAAPPDAAGGRRGTARRVIGMGGSAHGGLVGDWEGGTHGRIGPVPRPAQRPHVDFGLHDAGRSAHTMCCRRLSR